MADLIYTNFKAEILEGEINLATGSIRAVIIDATDYTVNAGDHHLSAISAAASEEFSPVLTTKTLVSGTFDADNVTFSSTSGDACDAVVLYVDTGASGSSTLICYLDSLSGLPVTLGGDVTISWDAAGIFTI